MTFDGGRYGEMTSENTLVYTKLKGGLWQKNLSTNEKATNLISGKVFTTIYDWTLDKHKVYFHKRLKEHHQITAFDLTDNSHKALVHLSSNSFARNDKLTYVTSQDKLFFTGDNYPQANIQMVKKLPLVH